MPDIFSASCPWQWLLFTLLAPRLDRRQKYLLRFILTSWSGLGRERIRDLASWATWPTCLKNWIGPDVAHFYPVTHRPLNWVEYRLLLAMYVAWAKETWSFNLERASTFEKAFWVKILGSARTCFTETPPNLSSISCLSKLQ